MLPTEVSGNLHLVSKAIVLTTAETKVKKIFAVLLILLIAVACTFAQESRSSTVSVNKSSANVIGIEITSKNNIESEKQTVDQLRRLLSTYDVSKWIFTKKIIIENGAIPHSHPVLTLNTKYLKDDELCLSAFVHEQLHWFVEQNPEKAQAAFKEGMFFRSFRLDFPKAAPMKPGITSIFGLLLGISG